MTGRFYTATLRRAAVVTKITNIGAGDGLEPCSGKQVQERLNAGEPPAVWAPHQRTTWLTTVNADGSPHVTAAGALWLDRAFSFPTAPLPQGTQRRSRPEVRDLDLDPRDGRGGRGQRRASYRRCDRARLAHAWADQGWPVEPDDEGTGLAAPFNAPGLGPAPSAVYRMTPRSLTAVLGVEPGGSTRFDF